MPTPVLSALGAKDGLDETSEADYSDFEEASPEERAELAGGLAH